MQARVIQVLSLLVVMVPLWARAAPREVEARLTVLEPVEVSEYRGGQGSGLRLTFKKLGYHQEIFRRVADALRTCRAQAECRARLVEALDKIAGELCTPGSKLNKLATGTP